jgi:hypothetical protein
MTTFGMILFLITAIVAVSCFALGEKKAIDLIKDKK